MRRSHIITIIVMLLAVPCALSAHNGYASKKIIQLCEAVGIKGYTDTIADGHYVDKFKYRQRPLSIIVNNGKVLSVGYYIFPKEQRGFLPADLADFIERYALESDAPIKREKPFSRQMFEDEFVFTKGNFTSLLNISNAASVQFSVNVHDNKRYKLTWSKADAELCSISFPIDHKLILGKDLVECEQTLLKDLAELDTISFIDTDTLQQLSLEKLFEPNYFIHKDDYFAVEQLNSNSYYKEVNDGKYELVFSKHLPSESMANLFTTNKISNNISLKLKVILYDFKEANIQAPLQPLLRYFKSLGCKTYFGVIDKKEDGIVSEILIENKMNGYCHIMKLQSTHDTLEKKSGIISGRMNIFIPTSKIKYLFQEGKQ